MAAGRSCLVAVRKLSKGRREAGLDRPGRSCRRSEEVLEGREGSCLGPRSSWKAVRKLSGGRKSCLRAVRKLPEVRDVLEVVRKLPQGRKRPVMRSPATVREVLEGQRSQLGPVVEGRPGGRREVDGGSREVGLRSAGSCSRPQFLKVRSLAAGRTGCRGREEVAPGRRFWAGPRKLPGGRKLSGRTSVGRSGSRRKFSEGRRKQFPGPQEVVRWAEEVAWARGICLEAVRSSGKAYRKLPEAEEVAPGRWKVLKPREVALRTAGKLSEAESGTVVRGSCSDGQELCLAPVPGRRKLSKGPDRSCRRRKLPGGREGSSFKAVKLPERSEVVERPEEVLGRPRKLPEAVPGRKLSGDRKSLKGRRSCLEGRRKLSEVRKLPGGRGKLSRPEEVLEGRRKLPEGRGNCLEGRRKFFQGREEVA
ncbi:hypothetical protein FNV43_RR14048 [Rhamnella rubrinervis]|uniref:Uncharacterized protein n=1 Tax=Rhamnella rubrinervis TaxID=2594499 RepID=A0A8K0H257_9ROSA|nr:hypothetical protein FNV43_RR14048 [Rhamnella rubrinervis]